MKYMLMIMCGDANMALSPEELADRAVQHANVDRELINQGKMVYTQRLRFNSDATTIRRTGEGCVVLDGPFADTKEFVGGFYLIDVSSMDEAIEWAKKIHLPGTPGIEVRPARTGATWRGHTSGATKYMLLFIQSASALGQQTRPEVFQAIDHHYELSLDLATHGKFICSRALEPPTKAVTVRQNNGEHVVTDGPFAEAKEFVAGFFLIHGDSKEEALEWGRKFTFGLEAVEVRPAWPTI